MYKKLYGSIFYKILRLKVHISTFVPLNGKNWFMSHRGYRVQIFQWDGLVPA